MPEGAENIHGTVVCLDGFGILIRGASGLGKSDLALRLIDQGAILVADDRAWISVKGEVLVASHVPELKGMLEVRGLGIVTLPHLDETPLHLVIDGCNREVIERLPEIHHATVRGIKLPWMQLDLWAPSAVAKVKLALRLIQEGQPPFGLAEHEQKSD